MPPPTPLPDFALAKIQPPRPRADLVERPALERALDEAMRQRRLTLLIAPAGYGKTAALTRQIRRLPVECALAWVSVDEDDQLQRFLACLTTALEPYDLPWRVAPEALPTLAQAERGLRDVAGEVVNALAAASVERGVIVIDDAHRITDPQVFDLLQLMLTRLPDKWTVVIASRVEPPLPLARWRAGDELAEFRQHDLRFSEAEVVALLTDSAPGDDPVSSARDLLKRTDGWAAGLRLSLSARPAGALALTQRHLFDYLADEVLDDMPVELRDFLLRCAVLPELSATRCAQLSGRADAARLLDEIERRGLFVSVLDAEELTLRLHDLFRDFLEDRLQREHPDELPALLRRAAEFEPDLPRAVGYLARAGAWDEAAQTLARRGPPLLSAGGGPGLEQMLALFPQQEFQARPDLHLLRGLVAFTRYDWDTLLAVMQRAADGYERAGRAGDAAIARAYACAGLHHCGRQHDATQGLAQLRALSLDDAPRAVVSYVSAWDSFACERTDEVAPLLSTMLDALLRIPDLGLWHQCANLSLFVGLPGTTSVLERFAAAVMRLSEDAPTQLRAGALHVRTCLALLAGRLDEAWQWLVRADEDCRWLGMPRLLLTDNGFIHVLMHALRGEREACDAIAQAGLHDMAQRGAVSHRNVHESDLLISHCRASWILQDEPALRRLDAALQRAANPAEWRTAERCRALSRSFVALLDGRLEEARQLLQALACDIDRHMFFPAVQARVLLADTQQRLGDLDAAAATLRPWLAAASHDGDIGGALLAGRQVLDRLHAVDWGGRLLPHERALLGQLPQRLPRAHESAGGVEVPGAIAPAAAPSARDARRRDRGSDLAQLSEREREVLQRMAAGDSNKLIARAFDLSPHTVKRHVANILGKLGADTRGQAAARWRDASAG
jgi:LuxR family maltose regulon positive regulatory protein